MTSITTTTESITLQEPDSSSTPVYGKLRYVAPNYTPIASPHNFHLPAMSEFGDVRRIALNNMRPVPSVGQLPQARQHAQLFSHGFTAVHHPTPLNSAPYTSASMKDPSLLKQFYIPETISMLQRITGCKTVVPESLLLRSALWSESDALATHGGHGQELTADEEAQQRKLSELETSFPQFIGFNPKFGGASPAPKIHLDYSPVGARTHVRCFHPGLTHAAEEVIEVEDRLASEGKRNRRLEGGGRTKMGAVQYLAAIEEGEARSVGFGGSENFQTGGLRGVYGKDALFRQRGDGRADA